MDTFFTSDIYRVTVTESGISREIPVYISLTGDGTPNAQKLPEELFKVYDGLGFGSRVRKTYFASFEFSSEAKLTVCFKSKPKHVSIKPDELEINPDYTDGILELTLTEAKQLIIQPDDDIFGGLRLFANERESFKPERKNTMVFESGVYSAENCEFIHYDEYGTPVIDNISDDTHIYIKDGAIVNAAIILKGVQNIKISGHGMISTIDRCCGAENGFSDDVMWGAFRLHAMPSIYIRSGSKNIEIEGVVLNCEFRGIVLRNADNIKIQNVKIFTSAENADGINCYNTRSLFVSGCFIQSYDDCFCMYNSCDSIKTLFDDGYENVSAVCRDVEFTDCIMSSNCRPVVLGGHATGCTDPRCIIEKLYMHDCIIFQTPYQISGDVTEKTMMYWSGFLRLLSQSEQIVRDMLFENITVNVTEGHFGKPFHLEVRSGKNASYTESSGYRIENITFRNIKFKNHTERLLPSLIRCRESSGADDDCMIKGISFENVTFNNAPMTSSMLITEGPTEEISIK